MEYLFIACIKDHNNNIIGYRLYDCNSKDGANFYDQSPENVLRILNSGHTIKGLELDDNGKITGSNGSIDRYCILHFNSANNSIIANSYPIVISKEYPGNRYEVIDFMGRVAIMNEIEVIQYSKGEGLANGKVVNNGNKEYISAIKGQYTKDKSFKSLESGQKTRAKMKLMGMDNIALTDDFLAYGIEDNQERIIIPKGCLGIKESGFKNFVNIKEVLFSDTCTKFGQSCFQGCSNIKEIKIPEGTVEIPALMFRNCDRLEYIFLPNSIRKIHDSALIYCKKLKMISLGPVRPVTGIPRVRGAKIVIRK